MNVYRTFVIGMKDLYRDMKQYVKIYKIANTSTLHLRALTRKELELYHQMPKDMKKVAPVFVLSALPLANYVIFPLAYMYPRTFLSPQFWSIQQKFQFQTEYLRERLQHNMRVFRFMQTKLDESKNDKQYKELKTALGLLGSGLHPNVAQLLQLSEMFTRPPFSFESLPGHHLVRTYHIQNQAEFNRMIPIMYRKICAVYMAFIRVGENVFDWPNMSF